MATTHCFIHITQVNEILDAVLRGDGQRAVNELRDFTGGDPQAAASLELALQQSQAVRELFEEIALRRASACIATQDRLEAARPR